MTHIVGDTYFVDGYFDLGFGQSLKNGIDQLKNIPISKNDIWIGNLKSVISDISVKTGERVHCFRIEEKVYKNVAKLEIY